MFHLGTRIRRTLTLTSGLTLSMVLGSVVTPVLAAPAAPAAVSAPAARVDAVQATAVPHLGEHSPAVRRMQRLLIAAGVHVAGRADGVFGPRTSAALRTFQRLRGLTVNGTLDLATALELGFTAPPPPHRLASFPVPANCGFADTWGAPRVGGRHHQGVDLFARLGTPIYAVETGFISGIRANRIGSLGGNQIWVTTADHTRYFYGHLNAFAKGMHRGVRVHAGQIIGFVGKTGLTTVTHLHFEWHPQGGPAVDPYAMLRLTAGC